MKKIIISLALCSFVFAETNESKIFLDKLPKCELKEEFSAENLRDKTKDMNLENLKIDANKSSTNLQDINFSKFQEQDKNAIEISNHVKKEEFKDLLQKNKDYLLYDKNYNFSKYTFEDEIKKIKTNNNQNKFLASNEKIFIVISSSLKKELIQNYFKSLENVNTDVTFILRGFVGNDIKKIVPTMEYVRDLLKKDYSKEQFAFKIDINPKITRKFNIKKVPAVIFIQNYDDLIEQAQAMIKRNNSNEKYFVSYGAVDIIYALNQINSKANSIGLDNLLKNVKKSFF